MWRAVIKSAIVWSDGPVCSERSRSLIESCLWPVAPFGGGRSLLWQKSYLWRENRYVMGESFVWRKGPFRYVAGEHKIIPVLWRGNLFCGGARTCCVRVAGDLLCSPRAVMWRERLFCYRRCHYVARAVLMWREIRSVGVRAVM
jgi:hypothetical protein